MQPATGAGFFYWDKAMKALKKIIIRLIIIEAIFTLMALAVTPFLLGSIKRYEPEIKPSKKIIVNKIETKVRLVAKKAELKDSSQKVAKKDIIVKKQESADVKESKIEEAEIIDPAPEKEGKDGVVSIQPVGEPVIIEQPGPEVPIEEPQVIK